MVTEEDFSLPDAPAIAGLVFRRFRGAADFAPMVAVREGSREWDQVDPLSAREGIPTVDELAGAFAGVPPGTRAMLLAELSAWSGRISETGLGSFGR